MLFVSVVCSIWQRTKCIYGIYDDCWLCSARVCLGVFVMMVCGCDEVVVVHMLIYISFKRYTNKQQFLLPCVWCLFYPILFIVNRAIVWAGKRQQHQPASQPSEEIKYFFFFFVAINHWFSIQICIFILLRSADPFFCLLLPVGVTIYILRPRHQQIRSARATFKKTTRK